MRFELASVEQWNIGLSASAVAASYALATPHFATSLAAGAFLEAINLGAIHRAAKRLFAGELLSGGWVGGLSMRFVILGAAIFITMKAGANPIALLIGLSMAMPATIIDAILNRPPIVDPATLPVFLEDEIDKDEDDRLWLSGRLFTSKFSDRLDDDWPDDDRPDNDCSDEDKAEADTAADRAEELRVDERNR